MLQILLVLNYYFNVLIHLSRRSNIIIIKHRPIHFHQRMASRGHAYLETENPPACEGVALTRMPTTDIHEATGFSSYSSIPKTKRELCGTAVNLGLIPEGCVAGLRWAQPFILPRLAQQIHASLPKLLSVHFGLYL